jgi:hypothetical protein
MAAVPSSADVIVVDDSSDDDAQGGDKQPAKRPRTEGPTKEQFDRMERNRAVRLFGDQLYNEILKPYKAPRPSPETSPTLQPSPMPSP